MAFDILVDLELKLVVSNTPTVPRQRKSGELHPVGVQAVSVAANTLADQR